MRYCRRCGIPVNQARGWECNSCRHKNDLFPKRSNERRTSREYKLRTKYGISLQDFESQLALQNGMCAVCGTRPALHVDHDHVTGRFRAICCELCNGAIGAFHDNEDLLRRAAEYLERFEDGE